MRKYLTLLSRPHAVSLLATNFFGRLPNGMGALAVVLFLRAHGVPYERVGLVAALYGLSSAVGGPVLGRIVDRRGQTRTLLLGGACSGVGFVLLAWFGSHYFVAALIGVALAGFFMPPLAPALRSLWSNVVPDQATVEVAYALDSSLQNVLFAGGPLLVVAVVGASSTSAALVVIGVLGIVGTAAFVLNRPVRTWRSEHRCTDWAGALRSRILVVLLGSVLCVGTTQGILSVASVGYAEHVHLSGFSGLLLGAFSMGSLVGGLAYGAREWSGDPRRRLIVLILVMALCTWPLAVVGGPAVMVALMAIAGLALAPVLTCSFVLIGHVAPSGAITEAFAWVTAVFLTGSGLGSAVSGFVLSRTDLRSVYAVAALAATLAVLVPLLAFPRRTTPAVSRAEHENRSPAR